MTEAQTALGFGGAPHVELTWRGGLPVGRRDGLGVFTHLIRHPSDEEGLELLGHHAGSGRDPSGWRRALADSAEPWLTNIVNVLRDCEPRTFNRICLEVTGGNYHADQCFENGPDVALWEGVDSGAIIWANHPDGVVVFAWSGKELGQ